MFRTVIICFSFLLVSFSFPVLAQDKNVSGQIQEQVKSEELLKAQNQALRDLMSQTMRNLGREEMAHFTVMVINYNVYSMVKAVRDDISVASQKCAKNNKSIASEVQSKFAGWEKRVGQSMGETLKNINSLKTAQTYLQQSEINTIFSLVDEVRSAGSSRFEKTPVTTPEACKFMMSKMDETEEYMTGMLAATLQSFPNVMRKNQN